MPPRKTKTNKRFNKSRWKKTAEKAQHSYYRGRSEQELKSIADYLIYYNEKKYYEHVSKEYKIPIKVLKTWVMRRNLGQLINQRTYSRRLFTKNQEDQLYDYIYYQYSMNHIPLTRNRCIEILNMAQRLLGFPRRMRIGRKYLSLFCKRYGLSFRTPRDPKRPETKNEEIKKFHNKMDEIIKNTEDDHIVNFDETTWRYEEKLGMVLAKKGALVVDGKTINDKESLTVMASITRSGRKLPLIILYECKDDKKIAREEETLQSFPPKALEFTDEEVEGLESEFVVFRKRGSKWCNQRIMVRYMRWLRMTLDPNVSHRIELVLDQFSAHKTAEVKSMAAFLNIGLTFIPGGATGLLQPLDRRVFGVLKSIGGRLFRDEIGKDYNFKSNLHNAVLRLLKAWDRVRSSTVKGSWLSTGCILGKSKKKAKSCEDTDDTDGTYTGVEKVQKFLNRDKKSSSQNSKVKEQSIPHKPFTIPDIAHTQSYLKHSKGNEPRGLPKPFTIPKIKGIIPTNQTLNSIETTGEKELHKGTQLLTETNLPKMKDTRREPTKHSTISNTNNICYAIAVFQLLASYHELKDELCRQGIPLHEPKSDFNGKMNSLTNHPGHILNFDTIIDHIHRISNAPRRRYEHYDAVEFFECIMKICSSNLRKAFEFTQKDVENDIDNTMYHLRAFTHEYDNLQDWFDNANIVMTYPEKLVIELVRPFFSNDKNIDVNTEDIQVIGQSESRKVRDPMAIFQIPSTLSLNGNSYELVSVTVKKGPNDGKGGHYVAFQYIGEDKFLKYNDSHMSEVNWEQFSEEAFGKTENSYDSFARQVGYRKVQRNQIDSTIVSGTQDTERISKNDTQEELPTKTSSHSETLGSGISNDIKYKEKTIPYVEDPCCEIECTDLSLQQYKEMILIMGQIPFGKWFQMQHLFRNQITVDVGVIKYAAYQCIYRLLNEVTEEYPFLERLIDEVSKDQQSYRFSLSNQTLAEALSEMPTINYSLLLRKIQSMLVSACLVNNIEINTSDPCNDNNLLFSIWLQGYSSIASDIVFPHTQTIESLIDSSIPKIESIKQDEYYNVVQKAQVLFNSTFPVFTHSQSMQILIYIGNYGVAEKVQLSKLLECSMDSGALCNLINEAIASCDISVIFTFLCSCSISCIYRYLGMANIMLSLREFVQINPGHIHLHCFNRILDMGLDNCTTCPLVISIMNNRTPTKSETILFIQHLISGLITFEFEDQKVPCKIGPNQRILSLGSCENSSWPLGFSSEILLPSIIPNDFFETTYESSIVKYGRKVQFVVKCFRPLLEVANDDIDEVWREVLTQIVRAHPDLNIDLSIVSGIDYFGLNNSLYVHGKLHEAKGIDMTCLEITTRLCEAQQNDLRIDTVPSDLATAFNIMKETEDIILNANGNEFPFSRPDLYRNSEWVQLLCSLQ